MCTSRDAEMDVVSWMIQVSGALLSEHINYHNKPEDAPQTDYALATYIGAQIFC